MAQEIVFGQVLQKLMKERYRRNSAALAEAVFISPSALSQYIRGRATPSLAVLVQLAEVLDVSLDYLVFGYERATSPAELGYLTGHLESHIRHVEEQNSTLHDLTSRIAAEAGPRLAALVRSAAEDLVSDAGGLGGTLSIDDVARLERCSAATTIFTRDLSKEVLVLKHAGGDDAVAPSLFAQVVVDNIIEGTRYQYIVPEKSEWNLAGKLLRHEFIRLSKLAPAQVDQRLKILHVASACIPGYVVQHVMLEKLRERHGDIFERVSRFIYPDPDNEQLGFVSYVEMVNRSSQHFDLIAKEETPQILDEIRTIQRNGSK